MRPGWGDRCFFQSFRGVAGCISRPDIVDENAFKPTSSILTPVRPSIARPGKRDQHQGPPRPCVGHRGAPVAEAMMALVLADQKLLIGRNADDAYRSRAWGAELRYLIEDGFSTRRPISPARAWSAGRRQRRDVWAAQARG